ncbi:MAG: hypothetical protein WCE56_18515 [Desulfobacterales bacterium]
MTVLGSGRQMVDEGHALEFIARINAEVEHEVASSLMNEKVIENHWSYARRLDGDSPEYWLLLVRLAEAALICAGNYADNCEYEAAGDLLVNPREILIHRLADGRSTVKNRHGRLSEQFSLEGAEHHHLMKLFSAGVHLEMTKAPLLPHMTKVLRKSERISPAYLQRLEKGQCRIANTLTFLSAWRIFDSATLWQRLQLTSAQERAFAESHLCRFDTRVFHQVGTSLQRSLAEPDYQSPFLAGPNLGVTRLKPMSPATELALASPSTGII